MKPRRYQPINWAGLLVWCIVVPCYVGVIAGYFSAGGCAA